MKLRTAALTITLGLTVTLAACNNLPSNQTNPAQPDPFIPQSFPEPSLPPGANTSTAATKGYWSPTNPWPLVAIHAILMPNGNIMTFDMQGDDPLNTDPFNGSNITFDSNINLRGSWDSKLGNWRRVDVYNPRTDTHTWSNNPTTDLFCSGHVLLRDGNVFVVGGHFGLPSDADGTLNPAVNTDPIPFTTNPYQVFNDTRYLATDASGKKISYQGAGGGKKDTNIFDWRTNTWLGITQAGGAFTNTLPKMSQARWYPSATVLANGNVLVSGGNDERGRDTGNPAAQTLEVFNGSSYTTLTANTENWPSYYPRTFQAGNGKVFYAGMGKDMYELDPNNVSLPKQYAGQRDNVLRSYGSAVMFERDKILVANGQQPVEPGIPTISYPKSAYLLDLTAGTDLANVQARKVQLPDVPRGRFQENATILADGSVLITGGNDDPSGNQNSDDLNYQVSTPILFKPNATATSGTWTDMADMDISQSIPGKQVRQYHSVALLMPDGRVFTAGAADCTRQGCSDLSDRSHEYFWPPYLFHSDGSPARRPKVQAAPSSVRFGSVMRVSSPDAARITRITWIRLGSVTHAFNMNQRGMSLSFSRSGDTLLVNAPENGNVAPPGHYMLFLLNEAGVPSVARIIRIDN